MRALTRGPYEVSHREKKFVFPFLKRPIKWPLEPSFVVYIIKLQVSRFTLNIEGKEERKKERKEKSLRRNDEDSINIVNDIPQWPIFQRNRNDIGRGEQNSWSDLRSSMWTTRSLLMKYFAQLAPRRKDTTLLSCRR